MRDSLVRIGLVGWIAAAWSLGGRRLLPRRFRTGETLLVWSSALGLAAGATALLLTGLALVGWLLPRIFWPIQAGWTALALLEARSLVRERRAVWIPISRWERLLAAALVATLLLTLIGVLAPPTSIDAMIYHLRVPREYLRVGRLIDLPDEARNYQPFNVEMLFAFGMGLRDDVVAAALHWVLGIGAALCTGAWARRLGARSALAAMTVFVVSPLFVWESTSSFIDLGLSLFASLALIWGLRSERDGAVWLAAVFSGLAAGSKFTGCAVAVAAGILSALSVWPDSKRAVGRLLLVGFVAAALAAPWYVRNALWTGNPFFPLGNAAFGVPSHRFSTVMYGYGRDIFHLVSSPFDLIWRGEPFDLGWSVGPAYLALVPVALLAKRRDPAVTKLAAVLAVFWTFWFFSSPQTRLLLPILPAAAGLAGIGCEVLMPKLATRWAGRAVVGISTAVGLATAVIVARGSWRVVAGVESRHSYLARMAIDYPAFEEVNRRISPVDRLAVTGANVYYLRPRVTIIEDRDIATLSSRGFSHLVWIHRCAEAIPTGRVLWQGRYTRPGSRFQGTGDPQTICAALLRLND